MADYLTARSAIATIIGAVAITTPVAVQIAHVYEFMPDSGSLNQFPSVVITGYQLRYVRGPSGKRERMYTIGLRLMTQPVAASAAQIQDTLDALKEAISAAFDAKIMLGLGGAYHVLEGPNWTSQTPVVDVGLAWDDGEILLSIKDAAVFTP